MSDNILDIRQGQAYRYTYSAAHEPIAIVDPGQRVRIHCVDCFENRLVREDQRFAEIAEYPYVNPQTGPVFVNGAKEGDTLLVHIDDIEITRDWAVTGLVPNFGLLTATTVTEMLTENLPEVVHKFPIRDRCVWFGKLSRKISPFMGTMGTAPKLEAINALTPSHYGGNMDCPETRPGNTVHLPVLNPGGLFFCGDGHATQGHGEIGGVACEVPVNLVCRFEVVKGQTIQWPRITNDRYMMVVGSARPLEDATRIACTQLTNWVADEYDMDRTDALVWITQVLELRVGNVCDPNYSVVAAVDRQTLESD
jgi:acetamidase/formamidase